MQKYDRSKLWLRLLQFFITTVQQASVDKKKTCF